ncbi:MAG TPA: hypothetical protein VFI47_06665, partial [Acidimicrobiales bacterium]|nr:hypothetical protein [Acidimicrobiales bacterium]
MAPAPEPLVVVGAGGFGRETVEVARAVNAAHEARHGAPRWEVAGFLDDDPARWGTTVGGTTILGPVAAAADRPSARVVVCTGNPGNYTSKRAIVRRLGLDPGRYASL